MKDVAEGAHWKMLEAQGKHNIWFIGAGLSMDDVVSVTKYNNLLRHLMKEPKEECKEDKPKYHPQKPVYPRPQYNGYVPPTPIYPTPQHPAPYAVPPTPYSPYPSPPPYGHPTTLAPPYGHPPTTPYSGYSYSSTAAPVTYHSKVRIVGGK